MKLYLLEYTCSECSQKFKSPTLTGSPYGEFILRSSTPGKIAYLNALIDKTYDEVDEIMKSSGRVYNIYDLYKVYSYSACDPDENGNLYEIGKNPTCPNCGSLDVENWIGTYPEEFIDIDVPYLSHEKWNIKDKSEKTSIIIDKMNKMNLL
ncbi:MAG: hypothetical protein C9355_13035 [Thalassolituus maritimus]|uniref:Uncharacterized protein n=1 Tax=Thalassolituus maritimus TaxID=484498 RepID=A0A1N7JW77_9GAMM|nr:hypothetical protein [Thalassolituus maritimus]TPD51867.1 MAG: hypothetical protein C9355_13035 [Thalassolituus maritimus]SIS53570.1 hypothetical protein SAMN05421686_102219 [Thalassolituus maritimus]